VGEVQSAALDVLENLATDKDASKLIGWDYVVENLMENFSKELNVKEISKGLSLMSKAAKLGLLNNV